MIEASPVVMTEYLETRVTLWNSAAERIFGWSRAEMLGRSGTSLRAEIPVA